jgi:predicted DNA-binding protein
MSELKPFLVRLTPQSVELLDAASKEQEKTKASIINDAIKAYCQQDLNARLRRL